MTDTMKRGDKEVQERRLLLQKEKDQLTLEYKDKRVKVDQLKEELQKKIVEYSKLAESGKYYEIYELNWNIRLILDIAT